MQGGTGATQDVFIEHAGIPTLPALRQAVEALQELGQHRKVQLIISGGIRSGADVAKALAMGADAVSIGTAALIALGCNRRIHVEDYHALGTEPGACHHCQPGAARLASRRKIQCSKAGSRSRRARGGSAIS